MASRRRPAKRKDKLAKKAKPQKVNKSIEASDKPSMPIEGALSIVTAILLVTAIILVKYEHGAHYNEGMFADKYQASAAR